MNLIYYNNILFTGVQIGGGGGLGGNWQLVVVFKCNAVSHYLPLAPTEWHYTFCPSILSLVKHCRLNIFQKLADICTINFVQQKAY